VTPDIQVDTGDNVEIEFDARTVTLGVRLSQVDSCVKTSTEAILLEAKGTVRTHGNCQIDAKWMDFVDESSIDEVYTRLKEAVEHIDVDVCLDRVASGRFWECLEGRTCRLVSPGRVRSTVHVDSETFVNNSWGIEQVQIDHEAEDGDLDFKVLGGDGLGDDLVHVIDDDVVDKLLVEKIHDLWDKLVDGWVREVERFVVQLQIEGFKLEGWLSGDWILTHLDRGRDHDLGHPESDGLSFDSYGNVPRDGSSDGTNCNCKNIGAGRRKKDLGPTSSGEGHPFESEEGNGGLVSTLRKE